MPMLWSEHTRHLNILGCIMLGCLVISSQQTLSRFSQVIWMCKLEYQHCFVAPCIQFRAISSQQTLSRFSQVIWMCKLEYQHCFVAPCIQFRAVAHADPFTRNMFFLVTGWWHLKSQVVETSEANTGGVRSAQLLLYSFSIIRSDT